MFSLMPRRRERRALARREPFEFFRREFAPLFEFPTWMMSPVWETPEEPWGFETEERENEFVLRAEAPGFEPSEVEVTLRGNVLTVKAEHTEPAPAEGEVRERRYARLERTMTLPPGVEREKVEARYHNGVIEVHLPRTPEAKPRRIEVKT
jgi:HSP20 family molecular chaperone IbpA